MLFHVFKAFDTRLERLEDTYKDLTVDVDKVDACVRKVDADLGALQITMLQVKEDFDASVVKILNSGKKSERMLVGQLVFAAAFALYVFAKK